MNINAASMPFGLISQFFPELKERVLTAQTAVTAEMLIKERIKDVLKTYR
jgi:tagatose-1,6-bisphosphate aldolase non-catalytic subunit AgaZ/GatZ